MDGAIISGDFSGLVPGIKITHTGPATGFLNPDWPGIQPVTGGSSEQSTDRATEEATELTPASSGADMLVVETGTK